jgi:copper chaperone
MRAVADLAGVGDVSVEVGTGRVTVHGDTALPIDSVRAAIDDAGYRLITA